MSNHSNEPGWVYILLTIIAIGAGLVRSVQKRFKDTGRPEDPFSWEEKPASKELGQPFWYDKPAQPDRNIEYIERPEYMPSAEEKEEKQPSLPNPLLSGLQEQEGEEQFEFDLKKAIIYSEILHRKYD